MRYAIFEPKLGTKSVGTTVVGEQMPLLGSCASAIRRTVSDKLSLKSED
jgi:hypothetical protein